MSDIIEIYLDYIDDDGYVHRYDYENKRYYNTRICLRGPAGNPGRPGKNGDSWSLKEVDGTYYWFKNGVNTGIPAQTGGGGETPTGLAKVAKTGDYNDLKNKPTIPTTLSQLSEDSTHRTVSDTEKTTWNNKSNFSGSYNDLNDKPTIPVVPTNVSAFNNDAGYLTEHQDISGKANKSEMSITDGTGSDSDKTTIQLKSGTSATVIKQHQDISGKQDALVSGTNIKTINNESLMGSGNISVAAELPSNLAYTSNDDGEGIIPSDGIRAVTVTNATTMTINPDVVTVIDGTVGTAAITLQVPQDNLAHVWDILLTTDSTVAITFAMSNSATILYPSGFSVGASKAVEISVIGVGTKYYLRYGEFA